MADQRSAPPMFPPLFLGHANGESRPDAPPMLPPSRGLLDYLMPKQPDTIWGFSKEDVARLAPAFWGPERTAAPTAHWLLENVVPGSSDAVALKDAYDASGRVVDAAKAGQYGQAALNMAPLLASSLAVLPAVPGIRTNVPKKNNLFGDYTPPPATAVPKPPLPALDDIAQAMEAAGFKQTGKSTYGSRYFEGPGGKTVRLADHTAISGKTKLDADIVIGGAQHGAYILKPEFAEEFFAGKKPLSGLSLVDILDLLK